MPAAGSTSETASSSAAVTGKADQYVPVFNNVQRHYKEYRKRCDLYRKKMELAGRSKETVFNLVTLMTGRSWDLVEDISIEVLQSEDGFKRVFERLDKGFKFDALTELPEDFETFFVKLQRKSGQTLQEYAADFARAERQLRITHKVDLPEKVKAWFFLRRSGINREQRQLVLTNLGADKLDLEETQKAMNFILGQDSKLDGRPRHGKGEVFYQDHDDEYDFELEGDFEDDDYDGAYYQDGGEDFGAPWPDHGQDYYDDGADEVYDVDEYDEVYASFVDAKTRMNSLRVSRGFYPVVALIDKGSSTAPPARSGKGKKGKGKAKGKGVGKQLPNAKGSSAKARGRAAVGRQVCLRCGQAGHWARNCPANGSGDKKRKVEENSDEVMMVTEVFAMDQLDNDEDEPLNEAVQDGGAGSVLASVYSIRRYLLYLLAQGFDLNTIEAMRCKKGFKYGNSATETTDTCLLLPFVLGGRKLKVLCYVIGGTAPFLFGRPLLEKLGVTVDYENKSMKFPRGEWHPVPLGNKGEYMITLVDDPAVLMDGNDFEEILVPDDYLNHVDIANPIAIDDVFGILDGGLAKNDPRAGALEDGTRAGQDGTLPLDGRAGAKSTAPDASQVDHMNSNRVPSTQGDADLAGDGAANPIRTTTTSRTPPSVAFLETDKPIDNDHVANPIPTTSTSWTSTGVYTEIQNTKPLTKGKLHSLILSATEASKRTTRLLDKAKSDEKAGEKLVWEVFAGKGRTSDELNRLPGVRAETFSQKTGWDFLRAKDRKKFLRKLQDEMPDEILLSPVCKLWSPMQEVSLATNPQRRAQLVEDRRRDHDEILMFAATVYEAQRRSGRHCHVEHPWQSRAWMTRALGRLRGYSTYVDQCQYELMVPDDLGHPGFAKKPTCFFTTKASLHYGLAARCPGQHGHVRLEGNVPGQGSRTKLAENYPPKLAKTLAKLMAADDPDDMYVYDDILAGDDASEDGEGKKVVDSEGQDKDKGEVKEAIRKNDELRRQVGAQVLNYVARLHKSLGHPSPAVLLRMLDEVQATDTVKLAAKHYVCATCYGRQKVAGVPPATGILARNFGDRLVADSAWVDTTEGRKCVLTLMDQATRYVAIRLLSSEKATDFIKGVERAWIKQFGVPKMLRVDEAKAWSSEALRQWTSEHGISLEVAPAESHHWLGAVERKHQVVRRSLELYMDSKGERSFSNLKEAAVYIPIQVNNMSFVRGFTPNQWLTGRTPMSATSLTADLFNPGADPLDEPTSFASVERRRLAARQAFLQADSDAKLRRAMNRNYRESSDATPAVGQRCWYWRVQGTPTLQKAKWRGPARVVAHEMDDKNAPAVIWVAHGTSLLRCSPHQVRPLVQDTGCAPIADPRAALQALQDLRARSTTQYKDVFAPEVVMEDLMEDDGGPMLRPRLEGWDDRYSELGADDRDRDNLDEYVPDFPSDADNEDATMEPVPGAVSMFLQQQQGQRRRHSTVTEPDPNVIPPIPPTSPKRARTAPSSSPSPTSPPGALAASQDLSHLDVPLPNTDEDELYVDEVYFVDGATGDLPKGWVVLDGDLVLDEVFLAKTEARERTMTVQQRAEMIQAKKDELVSYFRNCVWEFADPSEANGSRTISARWVLTWKPSESGQDPPRAKARLVLRGFQDPDVFDIEKTSPTASKQGKFLILALTPVLGWTLFCGDVRTAFLSGAQFDRKIIVRLPADCGPLLGTSGPGPTCMRLLKSAYGLADAPLLWWREADRRLGENCWKRHVLDRCLYCFYSSHEYETVPSGTLLGALVLHVDDLLISGSYDHPEFKAAVKDLKAAFDFGKWSTLTEKTPLVYCGGKLELQGKDVLLSFGDYIKKVIPVTIPKKSKPENELTAAEVTRARGLIGALQWPAVQGMPPLAASVSLLASEVSRPTVQLLHDLNKTLRFAKSLADAPLRMTQVVSSLDQVCFLCYSDAAFGVRSDQSSQGGYIIVLTSPKALAGELTTYNIVSWRSFKLARVCRSSLAAEAQAAASAVDELMMVKTMLALMVDPRQDPRSPATAKSIGTCATVIDARALYDALKKKGFTSGQDKRSAIEILCVQQELERLGCELRWVSSERMLADGLTKLTARQQMVDQLQSGKLKLVFDKDFVAAKKKDVKQRERDAGEAFGIKHYGSRTARQIANILAVNLVTQGADGAITTYDFGFDADGFYGALLVDKVTLTVFLGALPLVLYLFSVAWSWWRTTSATTSSTTSASPTSSPSPTSTASFTSLTSAGVDQASNTDSSWTRTVEDYKEQIQIILQANAEHEARTVRLNQDCRALRDQLRQLQGDIERHRRVEADLQAQVRQLHTQQQQRPPQLEVPARVFVTARGRRFHLQLNCGHIVGHQVNTFEPCQDCARRAR